jgi:ABC-type enterochelin transport system permease subunit
VNIITSVYNYFRQFIFIHNESVLISTNKTKSFAALRLCVISFFFPLAKPLSRQEKTKLNLLILLTLAPPRLCVISFFFSLAKPPSRQEKTKLNLLILLNFAPLRLCVISSSFLSLSR